MQSKTSSFKEKAVSGALLRKNLTRFWPLWAVYAAAWLIAVPLAQFVTLFGDSARHYTPAELKENAAQALLTMGGQGGMWMALIFGCLFAMALFSYLYSARSVSMMHSFPIRRNALFFTSYLSGAAVFFGTLALTGLLAAAIQGAAGVLVWKNLLLWLGCAAGQMLFFYSFACFCAMFTGQILALPVFYGVLNILVAGVDQLVQSLASSFIYGYSGGGTPSWVEWLTPAWKLNDSLALKSDWDRALFYSYNYHLENPASVAVYAAAGLVFAALALLVCRVRRSETAGDTVAVGWMKPVFCYGVGVCCALSLGQGLYELVWEQFSSDTVPSLPAALVCMVALGLVGYYAARMLLAKSFRVLRSGWKGAAAMTAALVALGVCLSLDVTGVERRVPDAGDVKKLEFSIGGQNYCSGTVGDADVIARFIEVHQALIADKDETRSREEENRYAADEGVYDYAYVSLTYHLEGGGVLSRNYDLYYTADDLAVSDSAAAGLAELIRVPEVQWSSLLNNNDAKAGVGHVTGGDFEKINNIGQNGYESGYVNIGTEDAQKLYDALSADIEAGNFGMNQFNSKDWEKETYANSLSIYYRSTDPTDENVYSIGFTFSANCENLLAVLGEMGLDGQLVLQERLSSARYGKDDSEPTADETAAPIAAEIAADSSAV